MLNLGVVLAERPVLALEIVQAFCLQKLPSVREEHLSMLREIGGKISDISDRRFSNYIMS
jgi:hypothetical protein